MKVKLIGEVKYLDLEKKINEFLESIMGNIIDIKFSNILYPAVVVDNEMISGESYYTALIMYESTVAD